MTQESLSAVDGARLVGVPESVTRPLAFEPAMQQIARAAKATDVRDVAAALDRAADYIDRHGWIQGYWWDTERADLTTSPTCASGALRASCLGSVGATTTGDLQRDGLYHAAFSALRKYLRVSPVTWNDRPGRSQGEVTTAMRLTAARLREQAAS